MTSTAVKQNFSDDTEEAVVNPKKFVLWLIVIASIMLFAGLTSAYIVRRGEGNWVLFQLPQMFAWTTGIIALSSISMQWAYNAARKDELGQLKTALYVTLALGILFVVGQWMGWKQLVAANVHLVGNPSESFVYVISGIHLLHAIAGIGFVAVMLVRAIRFDVHKKNTISISLCTTFWHFLGLLWIYLYFFLLLNR